MTYFFNIICPCALDCSLAVPTQEQAKLSSVYVTVNLDIDVALLVAFLLHLKTMLKHLLSNKNTKFHDQCKTLITFILSILYCLALN